MCTLRTSKLRSGLRLQAELCMQAPGASAYDGPCFIRLMGSPAGLARISTSRGLRLCVHVTWLRRCFLGDGQLIETILDMIAVPRGPGRSLTGMIITMTAVPCKTLMTADR